MPTHRQKPPIELTALALLLLLIMLPVTALPAPQTRGELIDVGGHLLYIHCQGESLGLPVVVLDAGLGGASPN